MKRRYVYSILFGVPGFIASLIVAVIVSGFGAGVLWLFVFGDNPWPAFIDKLFPALFVFVFLMAWLTFLITGYMVGRRVEQNPTLNKRHVLASIGVTSVLILFIVFQQASVGNMGPKSDSVRCSDFCSQKGYFASSMPPRDSGERSCSCLDGSGHEILKVPIDSIAPGR